MDRDEFKRAAYAAIDEIVQYHENLSEVPVVSSVKPGYLAPLLPTVAPEQGEPWAAIHSDLVTKIIPGLTHWQSPRFMAWFPAGVTFPSILGEIYCSAFNSPGFNWLCSPAHTELETIVMDWLARALALPSSFLSDSPNGGGGLIQGTASEAILLTMVAARERYIRTYCDREGLTLGSSGREKRMNHLRSCLTALSSDQGHSATQKAANVLGVQFRSVPVSYDDDLSLTGQVLNQSLIACRAEGLHPFFLTATFGTTDTCAVDDISSIKNVLSEYPDIWLHIDAAYAGAALICPEYQGSTLSFASADSFNMNMHKWLLVNFDCSCLFIQDREALKVALSIDPSYLQNKHTESGRVIDYRDWEIPLGRRFRALKIWFVMRSYGLEGMRSYIRRTVNLGEGFADLIRGRKDLFEIVATPRFALTCFRIKPTMVIFSSQSSSTNSFITPPGDETNFLTMNEDVEATANRLTKGVADSVNEGGRIFLTSSTASGKHIIRVVSANPNSEERFVREAFTIIVTMTEQVLTNWSASVTAKSGKK